MMSRLVRTVLAVTLVLCVPRVTRATASGGADDEKLAAQKMFEAGDGLYESGHYKDAITAFKNSHNLVASPNSRLMLARSLREAGHNQEACEEFRGTIRDAEASGGRYPEAQQAAQSELEALETQLAHEASSKPVEQAALPDSAAVVAPVPTAPSTVLPEATNAQSTAPAPSHTLATAAWISAGVGAVGLTTFGVFAYLDHKTYRALASDCPNGQCPTGPMNDVDSGRRFQLIANVGLGVAVVGAVAATTLFVLSSRKAPDNGARIALQASPSCLLIHGRF